MRYLLIPACLMLSVMFTGSAWADDDTANNKDRAGRRGEMRQKILDEFDADGDGELSEDERATAREAMRGRRGGKGKAGKGKGGKEKAGKGKGRGQRGGRRGPPDPGKLFDKYDANNDGQLSRAEFMKLAAKVRPPRPPRGPGKRDGARRGGPPRDGPPRAEPPRAGKPRAGKRSFDRDRPLQNRGDRPGPPPRPEGRRRLNDEEGPGARGSRGRGPGMRGHRDHGPPNPEVVFERFDEDSDDQLSREEFMRLAEHVREMRERHGRGGDRGMRGGHGPRRGPSGEDGPPGRRRSARPESDAGPELPATEDNSE